MNDKYKSQKQIQKDKAKIDEEFELEYQRIVEEQRREKEILDRVKSFPKDEIQYYSDEEVDSYNSKQEIVEEFHLKENDQSSSISEEGATNNE